jgi:hypothetical protein
VGRGMLMAWWTRWIACVSAQVASQGDTPQVVRLLRVLSQTIHPALVPVCRQLLHTQVDRPHCLLLLRSLPYVRQQPPLAKLDGIQRWSPCVAPVNPVGVIRAKAHPWAS